MNVPCEYESLLKNKTWEVVPVPSGCKPIKCKWVYKLKTNADGSIAHYKARLVAKGYSQTRGIDYDETFSPVVRMESVRLILSIVAKEDLELAHFDVCTAFLYGELKEEIFMAEPEGYESKNIKQMCCQLKKSLYGLKQASRVWNQCFITFLKLFNLKQLYTDSCVLVRESGDEVLIIAIYIDDGLLCSSSIKLLNEVISHLKARFEITLMEAECFVGM